MKLNFKRFKRFTSISKTSFVEVDVREVFADLIYLQTGTGIADKCLAEKIYKSDEDTDFTDEEVSRIRGHANNCQPWFVDTLKNEIQANINQHCDE